NVLFVDGVVKLLDFGLSSPANEESPSMLGTLAYAAPEVIKGEAVSEASDLYAVGVIAYEIFAGYHPYNVNDITQLIRQVTEVVPDVAQLGLAPQVSDVLQRLLAKQPEDRYQSASDIINAYRQATNQPVVYETPSTRESFLQAAQFVGRDAQMNILIE